MTILDSIPQGETFSKGLGNGCAVIKLLTQESNIFQLNLKAGSRDIYYLQSLLNISTLRNQKLLSYEYID